MIDVSHFDTTETLTCGEALGPAMSITEQADADEYLRAYVAYLQHFRPDETDARGLALGNLGYYAGYYGYDVMERVNRLFGASHPIIGNAQLSTSDLLKAGADRAAQSES